MSFETVGLSHDHWVSNQPVRDIFKRAFESAGIKYYHPHLLRSTLCKWGLKNLNQMQFKALSQNLGHDHAMTTYNSYANLSQDEQIETLSGIENRNDNVQNASMDELLAEIGRRSKQ